MQSTEQPTEQPTESHRAFRRTSRPESLTRARLVAMLEENASREYRAILADIGERQCDSLANFAMAEHLRSLMSRTERSP
jgi:hypothetical protein